MVLQHRAFARHEKAKRIEVNRDIAMSVLTFFGMYLTIKLLRINNTTAALMSREGLSHETVYAFLLKNCALLHIQDMEPILVSWNTYRNCKEI